MDSRFVVKTSPAARQEAIVRGKNYRFTVLTSRLIRLEYQEEGLFEDHATQCVLNRTFPAVPFEVEESDSEVHIITEHLHLTYTKQKFCKSSLNIRILGNLSDFLSVWYYGEPIRDLGGTARTLDGKDGACELEPGLMSKGGFTVLDDGRSLLLTQDGWIQPRKNRGTDLYFWGYGRDYKQCLKDFYHLSGATPMLPRYAFGNWWSRYYRYTQETFLELMGRFEKERIPFSVAVLDMDWHLVDIAPETGSGWTGYTWNRDLFPDPERFLQKLHEKNLKVSLNVHPADGIRKHEEKYPEMARAMGMDPESQKTVEFDITDPHFIEAYFEVLHWPLEQQGVDFWWIDWQSGSVSKMEGLDPLWGLNHYHYMDNCKRGNRGLCFSRYAGPGSHRYPVGFSGDSIISWETLEFQPYFTATAANIGYTWWSHDIGGHMMGCMDHELAVRWLQFGVFSPISRLHSSSNPFTVKEPWNYPERHAKIMKRFLRLRHLMVPYLFTMNERCHREGLPLVEPVYYEYPWEEAAYQYKNEYFFGTQLLVCPVTSPAGHDVLRAKTQMWLPEGIWFDVFANRVYQGGRCMTLYRSLEEMPVFAKAGAIIPTAAKAEENISLNPAELTVSVYPGADGQFSLYEEYGGAVVWTVFELDWASGAVSVYGDGNTKGMERKFRFRFPCWNVKKKPEVRLDGKETAFDFRFRNGVPEILVDAPKAGRLLISWQDTAEIRPNCWREEIFDFLKEAQISFTQKEQIYGLVCKYGQSPYIVQELSALQAEKSVYDVICELLWAYV